ncbi:MAG: DNA-directed DNA polymerase I [Candidatus Helarchaeota archaeon]|nr:DNA-directed DNA polymerase I [Candidatus Helarchaeota archaeon]
MNSPKKTNKDGKKTSELTNKQNESIISEGDYLLLSVSYDGRNSKAVANLYDQKNIRKHYDNSGHLPYLISNLTTDEIQDRYPKVYKHEGFEKFEKVRLENLIVDKQIEMTKVIAKDPLSIGGKVNSIREVLRNNSWEDRIRYHNCYIFDKGLIPGLFYNEVNGNLVKKEFQIPEELKKQITNLFSAESDEFKNTLPKILELFFTPIPHIERLALDIEVEAPENRIPDPNEAQQPVICISFAATDGFKKVLILEREGIEEGEKIEGFNVEIQKFKEEKELLEEIFNIINNYAVTLTFNGDNFDLKYLYNRANKIFKIRKDEIPIFLGREIALLKKGIHVDLYKFFHNRAIQLSAFSNKYRRVSLDEVSKALLNSQKIELDKFISDLSYNELAYYCFHDSELTLDLTQFNNNLVMDLIILLMRISKLSMEDVTRQGISSWLKNLFYFEHRQRGYLIPNPEYILSIKGEAKSRAISKGKKYLGAIVIEPTPGVFFNVVVLDFASLYPSVIQRNNLSYETINCPHKECKTNILPNTKYWVCTRKTGLSALIIGLLKELRVKWFKLKAKDKSLSPEERNMYDVIQFALKVIVNAAYGVFGFANFPLYCPPVADATTAGGRFAIEQTIKKAKELNVEVLYGDTDSVFLYNPTKEQIDELIKWSSKELEIELDVEKNFRWVALSDRKKNYLGVYPNGAVDIKGLTGKKSHTPMFLQKLFFDLITILSEVEKKEDIEPVKEKIKKLVKNSLTKLKKKLYSLEDLAFRMVLTRSLEKYKKTTPQHVKAAKQLQDSTDIKIQAGDVIFFVKTRTSDGVKPIQLARLTDIDTKKYKQAIESTFDQVLDALGISFEELTGIRTLDFFMK